MDNHSGTGQRQSNQWLKFLRPLLWWGIAMLAVAGYFQHQRMMEQTRIHFSAVVPNNGDAFAVTATLDGKPVISGQRISLGSHTLVISHPKTESFKTQFFGWYGGRDFGQINLKRATGSLAVAANPPAQRIAIVGSEFTLMLIDSTGTNVVVPTDNYTIRAAYSHWSQTQNVTVFDGGATPCNFNPQMGAVFISCNESPATYVVTDTNGLTVEKGDLPATVADVPSGRYNLLVTFKNHSLTQEVSVAESKTNDAPFRFVFGAAQIDSVPSGAAVYSADGNYLGDTPLTVTELPLQKTDFRLQAAGYDNALVSVTVAENQTNEITTNLISLAYLNGMQSARQNMAAGNFRQALSELEQALAAKPDAVDASNLLTIAKGRTAVEDAKALAAQGGFVEAGKKLNAALEFLPDDAEAKALLADYKSHEGEQIAQLKEKQTRDIFESKWKIIPNADLFDTHEYVTERMTPEQTKDALVKCYAEQWPKADVTINTMLADDVFEILFGQSSLNPLETARRFMLVVVGKNKDGKTLILFKNLEFQKRITGNLADDLLSGRRAEDWLPLHPSKIQMTDAYEEQIKFGVRMMYRKIKLAIGETTAY